MLTAIIVAAGRSARMGFDKLLAPLGGKPVVLHSIEAFERTPEVGQIILVTRQERIEEFGGLTRHVGKISAIIAGGEERHFSVWNGLQSLGESAQFVAIHDGARPLTTPRLISDCLKLAATEGAACCAAPVPDTVKRADAEGRVQGSVDRNGLWAMQTPQIFRTELILEAYREVIAAGELVTDEVSAVQKLGKPVFLLRNDDWNFKITVPQDLALAEQVLQIRAVQPSPR